MRPAAQVSPDPFAGVGMQVVVEGQLAGADLKARLRAVRRPAVGDLALDVDQFQLVGLVGQLLAGCLGRGRHSAGEPLSRLDDLAHALVEIDQILRGEGSVDPEVVVEAVLDRRADPEFGVGKGLLDGLGEHVRRRVPDDRPAVIGVGRDRLDLGVLARRPRQVAQLALRIPDDDHGLHAAGRQAGVPDHLPGRRARRNIHARRGRGGGCGGHGGLLDGSDGASARSGQRATAPNTAGRRR